MNFVEKNRVVGHLTIVKLDHRTGDEEVLYDDHNVITGGMGRSLTQLMTTPDCGVDLCNVDDPERPQCDLYHYQITRFQVGTGGDGTGGDVGSEASSTVSLGQPLTKKKYGNSLKSVDISAGNLYSEENTFLEAQDFGLLRTKSPVASSVVHLWSLDEETANGQLLNEAGLFVMNPYLKKEERGSIDVSPNPKIDLAGGSVGGQNDMEEGDEPRYAPGHLLAAYKKFTPIKKENYFTLLFRWSLSFPTGF